MRFCGRNREIYEFFKILKDGHCVNIYGGQGVGKTSFVHQLAYGLLQRNWFRDGIYYFPLRTLNP